MHAPDLELHVLAQLLVERAERLVHQQDVGLDHHGAGERHALLLAAGQAADRALAEIVERTLPQRLRHAAFELGAGDPAHPQAIGDVLEHVRCGKQRVVLEHHADVARAAAAAR